MRARPLGVNDLDVAWSLRYALMSAAPFGDFHMDKKFPDKPRTLTDNDISSQRSMSRRSLLGALGVGLGAAAATVVGAGSGAAQQGCTDNDFGARQDAPGAGVRCGPYGGRPSQSGCTDNDSGARQDPPGAGVSCGPHGGRPPQSGCSDNDSGASEDPVGAGRGCRAPGGPGGGHGGPGFRPKACTDSDGGPNQDPPGLGINCWT
jgi:hypothetical protein